MNWRTVLGVVLALLVVGGVVALVVTGVITSWLVALLVATSKLDTGVSVVVLVALFQLVALPLPTGFSILCSVCGFLFGFGWGYLLCGSSAIFGVAWSFLLYRKACGCQERLYNAVLRRKAALRLLDRAVADRGLIIVFLCRLTPIAYGWLNVALSLGSVRTRDYLLASAGAVAIEAAIFAFAGSTLRDFSTLASGDVALRPEQYALLGFQAFAVTALIVGLSIAASRIWKRLKEKHGSDEEIGEGDDNSSDSGSDSDSSSSSDSASSASSSSASSSSAPASSASASATDSGSSSVSESDSETSSASASDSASSSASDSDSETSSASDSDSETSSSSDTSSDTTR